MTRNFTDVLRRGILNTLANWPVILMRIAEVLVSVGVFAAGAIAVVVPLFVSAGVKGWSLPEGQNPAQIIAAILVEHMTLWIYLFAFLIVVALVLVVVHAFVMAGVTHILVEGERAVPGSVELRREQFAAFSLERWMAGARAWTMRIFWIYNGTWGLFGLIVLLPLLITALLMLVAFRADSPGGMVVAGCGGLGLTMIIALPLAYVFGIWTQKAIVVCVTRDTTTREALRSGWRETKGDFLRHFLIYFLITIISGGAGGALSGLFAPFASFGVRSHDFWSLVTGPVQITSFAVQMAVAAAVQSWLIGCFAAMTGDGR